MRPAAFDFDYKNLLYDANAQYAIKRQIYSFHLKSFRFIHFRQYAKIFNILCKLTGRQFRLRSNCADKQPIETTQTLSHSLNCWIIWFHAKSFWNWSFLCADARLTFKWGTNNVIEFGRFTLKRAISRFVQWIPYAGTLRHEWRLHYRFVCPLASFVL